MMPYKQIPLNNIFICSHIDSLTGNKIANSPLGNQSYKKWNKKHKANITITLIILSFFNVIKNPFLINNNNGDNMKIRLGYACISNTLGISSSGLLTFSHFSKLGDQAMDKLDEVILKNFHNLEEILKYNIANEIYFYRMTSNLIPLLSHPLVNIDLNKYKNNFEKIGKLINDYHMRVDMHIDPYYVLNSTNDKVVESTINICKIYRNMFNLMKISSNLILHIGGKTISKEEGIKRFINNFNLLDDDIKKMIVVENDDKIYNIKDTLYIAKQLGIPMCLDYHHYKCNNEKEDVMDYLTDIFDTFNGVPKLHFSSPKSKKEYRAHHEYIDYLDFIDFIERIKFVGRDVDIMLESKMKDEALFRLVRQLKYKGYKVNKNSIILKLKRKKQDNNS